MLLTVTNHSFSTLSCLTLIPFCYVSAAIKDAMQFTVVIITGVMVQSVAGFCFELKIASGNFEDLMKEIDFINRIKRTETESRTQIWNFVGTFA